MGILGRSMMAVAVIGAAGVIAGGGLGPAGAATTSAASLSTVQLPISTYSHMVVDPVHQHLFFSGGAGSTSILVTDYSGNTVATIPDEGGATGLARHGVRRVGRLQHRRLRLRSRKLHPDRDLHGCH